MTEVEDLFTAIIRGTCYYPDDLKVRRDDNGQSVLLEYLPNMADMGLIVGKNGKQKAAYDFVAKAISQNMDTPLMLQFSNSYVGHSEPWRPYQQSPYFDRKRFIDLAVKLAAMIMATVPDYSMETRGDTLILRLDMPANDEDVCHAISDVFYPYGIRNGQKVRIKRARVE